MADAAFDLRNVIRYVYMPSPRDMAGAFEFSPFSRSRFSFGNIGGRK